jgi:hypothetical protein
MRPTAPSPARTLPPSPSSPSPESLARRQSQLADEARRLGRRRLLVEAAALRSRRPGPDWSTESIGPGRDVVAARLQFHRAIDALVAAGGFEEAIRIVRQVRGARPN